MTPPRYPFEHLLPHQNAQSPKFQSPPLVTVKSSRVESHPKRLAQLAHIILPTSLDPSSSSTGPFHINRSRVVSHPATQYETYSPFWARACAHPDSVRLSRLPSFKTLSFPLVIVKISPSPPRGCGIKIFARAEKKAKKAFNLSVIVLTQFVPRIATTSMAISSSPLPRISRFALGFRTMASVSEPTTATLVPSGPSMSTLPLP